MVFPGQQCLESCALRILIASLPKIYPQKIFDLLTADDFALIGDQCTYSRLISMSIAERPWYRTMSSFSSYHVTNLPLSCVLLEQLLCCYSNSCVAIVISNSCYHDRLAAVTSSDSVTEMTLLVLVVVSPAMLIKEDLVFSCPLSRAIMLVSFISFTLASVLLCSFL